MPEETTTPNRRVETVADPLGLAVFQSLQFKSTAAVVALVVCVTLAVSAYLLRHSGAVVREQNDVQLVRSASLLAHAASLAIRAGDEASLHRLVHDAANGAPLFFVSITDTNGVLLASAEHRGARAAAGQLVAAEDRPKASQPVVPTGATLEADAPVLMTVTFPIAATESPLDTDSAGPTRLLGYVRTGMAANTWHRSMLGRIDWLIGIAGIALLPAVPIGFLAIRRIIAPVRDLADVMRRFSQGRLDARSRVHRRDEIGQLSDAFNRMADQHQLAHERALQLNSELEQRVAHRTRQLRELASREPLTGLYNRRHFSEVLERGFAEARRYGHDLSCLMIDMDGFKSANDQLGHLVGDELLILAATTIVRQLRAADVAARYGGDEFVVLLPQTDDESARVLAERILYSFSKETLSRHPSPGLSLSVGIASMVSTSAECPEDMLRSADQALYAAKRAGKNRVVVAPAQSSPVRA